MDTKDNNNQENPTNKKEAFYKKLKESLDNTTQFPASYLFKFIVPTDHTALNLEKETLNKEKEALSENDKDAINEMDHKINLVNEKLKTEDAKLQQVDDIFKNNTDANIQTKKSKSGKYTSKTIQVKMHSSDEVINKYKDAEDVKGIISL